MADYDLYYWPLPFRGQFIRAVLAYAGKSWTEHDSEAIGTLMSEDPEDQPIPFVGPPLLIEAATGLALAEMAAIVLYLGETLHLIPDSPAMRARTVKVVADANDVIDEITQDGGREMWTRESWQNFEPRLTHWLAIWEATGARHGLDANHGYLLGTPDAGVADIVTATLWSTMADRFPTIAALLQQTAPLTAALVDRMQALPRLAALRETTRQLYGEAYCGGEIEKSLRASIADPA